MVDKLKDQINPLMLQQIKELMRYDGAILKSMRCVQACLKNVAIKLIHGIQDIDCYQEQAIAFWQKKVFSLLAIVNMQEIISQTFSHFRIIC